MVDEFEIAVKDEQVDVEESAESDPGNVYLGYYSGTLAVSFEGERPDNITDVRVTRTDATPADPDGPTTQYHAVIAGVYENENGRPEPFHTTKTFYHAMAALTWVEENVEHFDLLPMHEVHGSQNAAINRFYK